VRLLAAALAAALALAAPAAAADCRPCAVAGGTYRTAAPPGWDGATPLGLLVVFHGYAASGEAVLANDRLRAIAATHERLLVAPDGAADARGRRSWAHRGSPSRSRDEPAFVDAVLADVRARFATSDATPVVAGFSQGGSMVWDLACRRGAAFGRYLAVAGGFWEPMPADCASPVGALVHVHGLDDAVVPLEGRPIGERWRQADIFDGFERFVAAAGCAATPDRLDRRGALHCRSWLSCDAGELALCLHTGGHSFELAPLADLLVDG